MELISTSELWIESPRKRLPVTTEGEVTWMETPLHYRMLAGALRVIVPTKLAWAA